MQNNQGPSTLTMNQVRHGENAMEDVMRPREGDVVTKTGLRRTLKLRSNSRSKSKSPQSEKKGKLTQERRRQIMSRISQNIRKATKGKTIIEQKTKVNAMLKKLAEKKLAEKMQKDLEATGKLSSSNSAKMEQAVELEKEMKETPAQQVDPKDARTYSRLLSQVASSAGGVVASAGSGVFRLLKEHGPDVASAVGRGLKDAAVGTVAVLGAIAEAVRESAAEGQRQRELSGKKIGMPDPSILKLKQRTTDAPQPDFDPTQIEPPGADSPPSSRSSSKSSSSNKSYRSASPEAPPGSSSSAPRRRKRQTDHVRNLKELLENGQIDPDEYDAQMKSMYGHETGHVFRPSKHGGKSQKKNKKNKRGTMKHYFY